MNEITFLNLEYFFLLIYNFFTGAHIVAAPEHIRAIWKTFSFFSTFISLLFLSVAIYSYVRLRAIRRDEVKKYGYVPLVESPRERHDPRWQRVEALMSSLNENDWRQAIIEADVMLDDMLKGMGYPGDTLGERLKSIESSDFETLNDAWEAHKIRNEIAHGGLDYHLDRRRAQHAVNLFGNVFRANYLI